jgi:hypothetical protein
MPIAITAWSAKVAASSTAWGECPNSAALQDHDAD